MSARVQQFVKTHGLRDPDVQEILRKINRFTKTSFAKAGKAKTAALKRLGLI